MEEEDPPEEEEVNNNGTQNPSSSRTFWTYPLPKLAIYILLTIFLAGFTVSIFILVVVHNASVFIFLILLSSLLLVFLLWNGRRQAALRVFLRSLPDSDLGNARDGQLVKITGPVSCGSVSLESSYEKVAGCIYTSTLLYEYNPSAAIRIPFWRLTYAESISTDFYISDPKSGITASVKAGRGANVIHLLTETTLIQTTTKKKDFNSLSLSPILRKWFNYRHLSPPTCRFRLLEGFIREGDNVTVFGVIRTQNNNNNDEMVIIVQPPQILSTGCLWFALLLPMDFNGLLVLPTPS